jgi:2-amino-4-hydroxy-6-hydroxymethyldihydropteridine diphosphokinase
MHDVFLGLGANLGDRVDNLRRGLDAAGPEIQPTAFSALYETAPVGVLDQPLFLNAVCRAQTELDPEELLDHLKKVERQLGRSTGPIWGPRPLDLDILLYDDVTFRSDRLQIPHARLAERGFVLRPLADLAPCLRVPGLERTVEELLSLVGDDGVHRVAGPEWQSN